MLFQGGSIRVGSPIAFTYQNRGNFHLRINDPTYLNAKGRREVRQGSQEGDQEEGEGQVEV